MFGRDTHTPKPKKSFEPRPLRTISIDQVLTAIPALGTQESYLESYSWWINPENTVTLADIAALYQYPYSKDFIYKTPSEKSNSIWYTQYPDNDQRSSQRFEILAAWGGNKRQVSHLRKTKRNGC